MWQQRTMEASLTSEHHARKALLRLPEVAGASEASRLRQRLAELASSGRPVRIEGADVERISTACVQVLLAAEKTLAARGEALGLINPSPALRTGLTELGLDAELERWTAAAS